MSKFVTKLNKDVKEIKFLAKLEKSFNTVNSKNILLNRTISIFQKDKSLYVLFEITPVIPSIMLYASLFCFMLYGGIYLAFNRNVIIIFIGSILMLLLHFFWTKYFFYFMFKRSTKKHNIKTELI